MTATPLRWMPAKAFGGLFKPPAATFVTVHCTESDNGAGTAESLAGPNWFGGPAGTSAHRIFDRDSGVEMVRVSTVAYHAGPGGNTWGRSYEFCGRASWPAAKWREPEQLQMLRLAAPHMAQDLIEMTGSRAAALAAVRWLSLVQVARHEHGLCTHNDIRLAFGGTTHSDPGPNFPYAELLAYVRAEFRDTPQQSTATSQEDDMPQAVTTHIPAGEEVVFAFPPAGPGAPGGAAGWGRGWLTVLGDRFGAPGGDIHARIALRGADGTWRPALGNDMNVTLPPGTPVTIPLSPGDNAAVLSDTDGNLGACVEYAKA